MIVYEFGELLKTL